MRRSTVNIPLTLTVVAWAAAVVGATASVWSYKGTPTAGAAAPLAWPSGSTVERAAGLPTLLVFMHPHCPCSAATVEELGRLQRHCIGKARVTVLMLRLPGAPEGSERTTLWRDAQAIPGVRVIADEGGAESHRFGVHSSGQTLLYSPAGRLLFAGGITPSRGHEGDNAGRSALTTLITAADSPDPSPGRTAVFGCALFDSLVEGTKQGGSQCPP